MSEYHKKFTKVLVKAVQDYLEHKEHYEKLINYVGSRHELGNSERQFNDDTQKELLLRLQDLVAKNPYKNGDKQ